MHSNNSINTPFGIWRCKPKAVLVNLCICVRKLLNFLSTVNDSFFKRSPREQRGHAGGTLLVEAHISAALCKQNPTGPG